jgi:hypothetical protein
LDEVGHLIVDAANMGTRQTCASFAEQQGTKQQCTAFITLDALRWGRDSLDADGRFADYVSRD